MSSPQQDEKSKHGTPPDGLECLVTMEDITIEDGNYVEYQCYPSLEWKPALMERSVVEQLLQTQFQQYLDRVKQTDCQAELKRLLATGPPIYVSDAHGLPLPDDQSHVVKLWYASDNAERSAKLHGAVEGEERDKLWEELRQFVIVEGKEPGDNDEDEDQDKASTEKNGSIQPQTEQNPIPESTAT
jgi:hypothetical protein